MLITSILLACFSCIQTAEQKTPHYLYLVINKSQWQECHKNKFFSVEYDHRSYFKYERKQEQAKIELKVMNELFSNDFALIRILTSAVPGKFEYKKANPKTSLEKDHYIFSGIIPLKAIKKIK